MTIRNGGSVVPEHIAKQMEDNSVRGVVAQVYEQKFRIEVVDGLPHKKLIAETFTKIYK